MIPAMTVLKNALKGKLFLGYIIKFWRPGPELNRCTRFCKPLHNHSATGPRYDRQVIPKAAVRVNDRMQI